jgi:opacity protein-like surface antigen
LSIVFVLTLVAGGQQPVFADWRLVPFVGVAAGARTGYFDPDDAAKETRLVVGAAVGKDWNRLAVDVESAYVPGVFTGNGEDRVITNSSALLLSGNLMTNLPRIGRVTPYVLAGIGALHVRIRDEAGVFPVSAWEPAVTAGGGMAIRIRSRFSLRADVRYTRSRRAPGAESSIGFGTTYLDFWRSSLGMALAF